MALDRRLLVEIKVTNWVFSIGGEHFNFRAKQLGGVYEDFNIKHPLTADEAKELNKKDRHLYADLAIGNYHKPGQMCDRFWSKEQGFKLAVPQVREKWPATKIIMEGDGAQACLVLWCSNKVVGPRLKVLGRMMERLYRGCNDPWTKYPEKTKTIDDEWQELLEKL